MKKILFLFILIFSLISLINHNNYSNTQTVSIYSEVAKPIFDISFEKPVILDNSNQSVEYSFTISNSKENIISDIPFTYYFCIENLPSDFSVKCYMNSQEIILNNLKSETFLLGNTYKEDHVFNIYINYIGDFMTSIFSTIKLNFRLR